MNERTLEVKRLVAAMLVVAAMLAGTYRSTSAESGSLPTSVCSDGQGFHSIYKPHSGADYTLMQTWGEVFCNDIGRYHKIELYYYYAGTHEWKRVADVDTYTTSAYDVLVLNQCAQPANEPHAWQARSRIGGGHEGWSAVVYPNMRIAADGTC
jgi:hypothetical protein